VTASSVRAFSIASGKRSQQPNATVQNGFSQSAARDHRELLFQAARKLFPHLVSPKSITSYVRFALITDWDQAR